MAALTRNAAGIDLAPHCPQDVVSWPVVADDRVYHGALLENSSGNAAPLSGAGTFVGIALQERDNSGGAAGDERVEILTHGVLAGVAVAGSTPAAGDEVYCATDNVADLTIVATSATLVGQITQVNADGTYNVRLLGLGFRDQDYEARITTNTA